MKWQKLQSADQLAEIKSLSTTKPVLIFKHSTRCSISSMALSRLERAWKEEDNSKIEPYYLDLIEYRPISNQIAQEFNVMHESPQVLVIKDGKCLHTNSHSGINYFEILEAV